MGVKPPLEKKPLILVVDDKRENLQVAGDILKKNSDYNVVTAQGGADAIELAQTDPPDLILLDVRMPGTDGYAVCKILKASPETAHIPIIFMNSEKTDPKQIVEGFKAGGADYVTRPLKAVELIARVRTQLELRFTEQAYQSLVNFSHQGMMILQKGRCWFANPKMAEICGYPAEELVAMGPAELKALISQADQHKIWDISYKKAEALSRSFQFSVRLVRKDGRIVWVNVLPTFMRFRGEPAIQLTLYDFKRLKYPESLPSKRTVFGRMIGGSQAMQKVYTQIEQLGDSARTVLISGETGTGKELAAEALHENSRRSQQPMVRVNCAAIPDSLIEAELFGYKKGAFTGADQDKPGFFEQADGGTLFLDEIGDLPLPFQAKLLRVLENGDYQPLGAASPKKADARLIVATNADLGARANTGGFRPDLFYRLSGGTIRMPPLRERNGDILMLMEHFLETICQKTPRPIPRLSSDLKGVLAEHPWPGNVRELKNLSQLLCTTCPDAIFTRSHLPTAFFEDPVVMAAGRAALAETESEKETILRVLRQNQWHKSRAARDLGIARSTLYRKLTEYGLGE